MDVPIEELAQIFATTKSKLELEYSIVELLKKRGLKEENFWRKVKSYERERITK